MIGLSAARPGMCRPEGPRYITMSHYQILLDSGSRLVYHIVTPWVPPPIACGRPWRERPNGAVTGGTHD